MSHDYDLALEALQADLDAAAERYARLQAEHATLKILHEGAQHMNGGFAQQVTALTARVAELETENARLIQRNGEIQDHLDDYLADDPDM